MIWRPSKDFGISGFCLGALHARNKDVASATCSFGYPHSTSGTASTNCTACSKTKNGSAQCTCRLTTHGSGRPYDYDTGQLKLLGIAFLSGGAGLNSKWYLEPCTSDEELALHQRFLDMKLMLSHGKSFKCKEPGWFHLKFAEKHPTLEVAMHRLHNALQNQKKIQEQKRTEKMLADAACFLAPGSIESRAWGWGKGGVKAGVLNCRYD